MAFGELYSRKGILYGVVASVLRKHPAFSARVERLRTAPWNWQSWQVPWYFWQNSSSSDVGGIEQHDMTALQKSWKESNLWCCATLVHFWFKIRWHPTKSHRNMVGVGRENGRTLPQITADHWEKCMATCHKSSLRVPSNQSFRPGSLQRSLLQLPRICTNQCCLATGLSLLTCFGVEVLAF